MRFVKSRNVNLNVTKKISLTKNWTKSYRSKMSISETCNGVPRLGIKSYKERDLRQLQTNYYRSGFSFFNSNTENGKNSTFWRLIFDINLSVSFNQLSKIHFFFNFTIDWEWTEKNLHCLCPQKFTIRFENIEIWKLLPIYPQQCMFLVCTEYLIFYH